MMVCGYSANFETRDYGAFVVGGRTGNGQGRLRNGCAPNRAIVFTTVLSTMEILHRKGHLHQEREGKAFAIARTA